jgi:membrane fusion protein, multidrug efflux system
MLKRTGFKIPRLLRHRGVKLLLASMILLPAGCNRSNHAQGKPGGPPGAGQPVPVTVGTAVTRDIPVRIRAIGTAEPYTSVQVKSLIDGQITTSHFKEGQFVKKGDMLFTIDPRPYQAQLAAAEAALAKDTVTMKYAQRAASRSGALVKEKSVSAEQDEQVQSLAEAAAATIKVDEAAVESAKLKLDYASITSPIDGRTGNVTVNAGNVVKANGDTPLVTILQIQPIYVAFSVPERYIHDIREHFDKAPLNTEANLRGDELHPVVGKLTFVNNEVDKTAGTVLLKSTFDNQDKHLWPGQFVDVKLDLTTISNALLVPSQAVLASQQGQSVYVVKPDSTVELRQVMTGDVFEGQTIIQSGIKAGEKVVTDGQLRLVPGARVQVAESPAADVSSDQKVTTAP